MRKFIDQRFHSGDGSIVIRFAKVDRAADLGVHFSTAQFFRRNLLPDRAFHQRGTSQIKPRTVGHHQFVTQHRQVSPARNTVPHDRGDLRYSHR